MMDNELSNESVSTGSGADSSEKKLTMAIYVLQAASFLFGLTALVGLVINYIKRGDVENTWLESHFRWQIRTFWYGLLWSIVGFVGLIIVIGYLVWLANVVWIIYRIAKGWIRLADNKPMYEA